MKLCRKGLAIRPRVCAYCRYKCRLKQEIGRIAKRIIHLREKNPNRFGWTFYGAGDEASPPRAAGTPMVALPSSRQCPTVHRTVGFNCSSLVFHPQKKPSLLAGLFYGAGDEARTRYLHLGKVALYRMSYTRMRNLTRMLEQKTVPTVGTEWIRFRQIGEKMVPPVGIEPTTRGFSVRCSTY